MCISRQKPASKGANAMHRKLRSRFFIISWLLLLLFLAAICIGVSLFLYQSAAGETEKALRSAAETHTLPDSTRGIVSFQYDEKGTVRDIAQMHLNLSSETIGTLAKKMEIKGELSEGKLMQDDRQYRYLAVHEPEGVWAVIAECSQEQALVKTLRRNSILFTLLGAFLLIPVCAVLTKWVSKPIETAWEQQNDFVSDATHELKTPLTVIATNTEAVMANPNATIESQEKWLDSIQGETTRMAGLVGDLLFLAKIDAHEIHPDPEELEVSDLLEEMCMERESQIFEAGRMFDYEMTPGIRYIGDARLIRRMVDVLLDNAEKYTPEGGSIRMVVNRDRKLRLRIVVSNSGDTIPPEALQKIFDRFYRVDPARARDTGGYGLGLCVAKSIAELHGGTITASSENGINVFTVILGELKRDDGEN